MDRQTLSADPTGRYTTTYDKRGLATRVENPNQKTITYSYDSLGRRRSMIDPDGGRTTYAYDAAGRMTWLDNPFNERTTWTYDNLGRTVEQQLANLTRATYTFDPAGQLTRLANIKSDDSAISTFDYRYDNVGNRVGVTEANGDLVTWSYDKTYQLTREQRDGSNTYDVTHTYDSAGNRLVKIDGGERTTFAYDVANQLSTSEDSSGTTTYEYDDAGNLTVQNAPGGRTTNIWDAENRLILIETPTLVNSMAYRADGLRVQKIDSGGTSKFIWDGANILLETNAANVTQAAYTIKSVRYGNLISQRRDAESYFHHFDALGSTSELTDIEESEIDSYVYRAYGQLVASTSNTLNPFLWVGQAGYFFDPDILAYYIRTRHYDPVCARWLSLDPIGIRGRDANFYRYVSANPINRTDPTGLVDIVCHCATIINHGVEEWDVTVNCSSSDGNACCSGACGGGVCQGWDPVGAGDSDDTIDLTCCSKSTCKENCNVTCAACVATAVVYCAIAGKKGYYPCRNRSRPRT